MGIFVALATAITIFVISSSYSQIIELFPAGGGGYLVAITFPTARDLGRGFETATAEEVASKNREYMMGKRVEDYAGNAKSTYGAATGIMGKLGEVIAFQC